MTDIIKLENFFMKGVSVRWFDPPDYSETISAKPSFDYIVRRDDTNPRRFLLQFQFSLSAGKGRKKIGYEIETEICGIFFFPESVEENKMQTLIRVNGLTILYGVLRGEIGNLTGSFPGGKFVLPTVLMHDVVEQIEIRKYAEEQEPSNALKGKRRKANP